MQRFAWLPGCAAVCIDVCLPACSASALWCRALGCPIAACVNNCYHHSRALYDRRISAEVEGELLGDEFKGYVFRISGGNDKQGFAMKQGVLTASRVRLLFSKGMSCYRPRCKGERKRKSTRGCIVSSEMSVVNLVVVKKGETVRVVVLGFWLLSLVILPESEDELVRTSSCMNECIFVVVVYGA